LGVDAEAADAQVAAVRPFGQFVAHDITALIDRSPALVHARRDALDVHGRDSSHGRVRERRQIGRRCVRARLVG
jgi:hypothetical protein